MHLGAIVPAAAADGTRIPTRTTRRSSITGTFPSDAESDGWRETPPDRERAGTQRDTQVAAYQFYKDWNGPKFPRMIHVLVQHPTPYFDDSYAVNSANNGPYGDAITHDLIPDDREAVPRHRAGMGARHDRRIDRRLGGVRRAGDVPGRLQRRRGRCVPIRSTSDPIDR